MSSKLMVEARWEGPWLFIIGVRAGFAGRRGEDFLAFVTSSFGGDTTVRRSTEQAARAWVEQQVGAMAVETASSKPRLCECCQTYYPSILFDEKSGFCADCMEWPESAIKNLTNLLVGAVNIEEAEGWTTNCE